MHGGFGAQLLEHTVLTVRLRPLVDLGALIEQIAERLAHRPNSIRLAGVGAGRLLREPGVEVARLHASAVLRV